MGEMKGAQELRVDEFSVHKLRECHDTIQRLTSQNTRVAREGELHEWFRTLSRYRIELRSQSTSSLSKSSIYAKPRQTHAIWFMEFVWSTGKNVFGNPRPMIDSSQTPYQGILHSTNQSATGGIPVQRSTMQPVARGEERIGITIPMPMPAGRLSTMNSFLPAEIHENSMAVQQRLQISELQFDTFPTPSPFSSWKIRFKTQVSSCSDFPSEAMLWIKEVAMVDSVDDLKPSRSIQGTDFLEYDHPKFLLQE